MYEFKKTENIDKKQLIYHLIVAILFLLLFLIPIGMDSLNFNVTDINKEQIKKLLIKTPKLPFNEAIKSSPLRLLTFFIYLIPINCIILILSPFIDANLKKLDFISTYITLSVYFLTSLILFISTANSPSWFAHLPIYVYFCYFIAVGGHIFLTIYAIIKLKKSNPQYVEFKKLAKSDKSSKNKQSKKYSIKIKLNATIISTTTIILFTFMILVLNRYKELITEAVSDIGCSLAKQAASVYETAGGMNEPIANFFEIQKTNNSYVGSPYERMDIIIKSNNSSIYLEEITPTSELPEFDIFAYTTGTPSKIIPEEKIITPQQAHEYIKYFQSGLYERQPIYQKITNTCKYIHPITFKMAKGKKLVGFSIVTYKKELLMEALFKTKVFVFSMTLLFLYILIFISLILADLIVNPLLFLKLNVRKTSDSIAEVLSGSAKIEANSLTYEDTINTKDEVKDVSIEVGNLIQLIRGIIPYISFSTLKNAEKDSKRSTARELCFLFTDIRGFTSLCEGLQPKEVVGILNHYLDIETEIILNNGGDVDKFVGDEMMAFFAGPRKEYNACKAAMEIRAAMAAEQQKAKCEGDSFISIGIGINSGKVVFGPVGSKTRMDFTSIGDTVNLASRLEGANKAYGSKSIITENVYIKLHDSFICRELDFIRVKGKTKPIRIYEILQKKTEATDKIFEIKDLFEKGLIFYRERNWDEAEKYFNTCAVKYRDYPSIIFMDRIRHFKQTPPPKDWDGVFTMKGK